MAYRRTKKAQAMMDAKLLADIDVAPIIDDTLIRAATEATVSLHRWIVTTASAAEAVSAGLIALQRLRRIRRKAKSVRSSYILKRVMRSFEEAIQAFRVEVHSKYELETGQASPSGSGWMSEDDEEWPFDVSTNPTARTNGKGRGEAWELPLDIQRASEKAALHRTILWLALFAVLIGGTVALILVNHSAYKKKEESIERRLTIEMALIVSSTLDVLFEAMTNASVDLRELGPTTAAKVLFDMSSRSGATQDVLKLNNNHLTEYRGAVQDFEKASQVTEMLTDRAYGGICQTNITYRIQRMNDIHANESFVFPALTPNNCGNDATTTGLFSYLVPSYIRYTDFVTTYRRNSARLATFYHSGFGLSVAVTHDIDTLQTFLVPKVTLLGDVERYLTIDETYIEDLAVWCGLSLGVSATLLFLVILWMMGSKIKQWRAVFYLVVFLTVGVTLTAILLVIQAVFSSSTRQLTVFALTSLTEGVVGALLSSSMIEYGASEYLLTRLTDGVLKGRFFTTNMLGDYIYPEDMTDVSQKIDATYIASFRRGQYYGFKGGYAVAGTYLQFSDTNVFIVKKLESTFHADISIAVIIIASLIAPLVAYCYLRWSPLSRLRPYGVGSTLLRYRMHGSAVRAVFYGALMLLSVVGIAGASWYAVNQVHEAMRDLAGDTLILIGSFLRPAEIVQIDTDNTAMPDFAVPLYYTQKFASPTAEYPTISVVEYDLPYPFPPTDHWVSYYIGSQLSLMNIHTSVYNVPSFFTPLVNVTTNITDPRFIKRNMLTTVGINSTAAFSIERFPDSYFPQTFQYLVHSIGLFLIMALLSIAAAVIEWQYIKLHERHSKQQSLVTPYIIMAIMIFLVFVGFLIHGVAMKSIMLTEFEQFAESELGFMASVMSYRFEMLAMKLNASTREEKIAILSDVATNVSTSAMLMGMKFGRIRIAAEDSHRGSGVMRVYGVPNNDPVDLGSMEMGYLPVCGETDAEYISNQLKGRMRYCFVEVIQIVEDVFDLRLYVIAAIGMDAWVKTPVSSAWPTSFGVTVLIGFLVTIVIYVFFFLTMHACHSFGYAVLDESRIVESCNALPPSVPKEFFIPRHHRILWTVSFIFLGLIVGYYSISIGNFVRDMDRYYDITAPYQTEVALFQRMERLALVYAYSYVIYPVPEATKDQLLAISSQAPSGANGYHFVHANSLLKFQDALTSIYWNLTNTQYSLTDVYQTAKLGFGTYSSLVSYEYNRFYIANQLELTERFDALLDQLESIAGGETVINYVAMIDLLNEIAIARELIRKLFILDHMALTSYCVFSSHFKPDIWPFPDSNAEAIQANTLEAKNFLTEKIEESLDSMVRHIQAGTVTSTDSLVNTVQKIIEDYPQCVALNSNTALIWTYQNDRMNEVFLSQNSTLGAEAREEEIQEVACILQYTAQMIETKEEEGSARKSMQLTEYFRNGEPMEQALVKKAFQRLDENESVRRRFVVCFTCTMAGYIVVGVCILAHFRLLRIKTGVTQDIMRRKAYAMMSAFDAPEPTGTGSPWTPVTKKKSFSMDSPTDSQKKHRIDEDLMDNNSETASILFEKPTKLDKEGLGKKEETVGRVEEPEDEEWQEDEQSPGGRGSPVSPRRNDKMMGFMDPVPNRKSKWVTIPVGLGFLVTLIPLVCSFWLLNLYHDYVSANMADIAVVLNLYENAVDLATYVDEVEIQSVKYYTGASTASEYDQFLHNLDDAVKQFIGAYRWGLELQVSAYVSQMNSAYADVLRVLDEERTRFVNRHSIFDVKDYYTPQSEYARATLETLVSDNTYGVLTPVGVTTDGSAVKTFLADAYNTAKAGAGAATTSGEFLKSYITFTNVIISLGRISTAELNIWHATVAAARNLGAPIAVEYSQFNSLVGSSSGAVLETSTEPSASAAEAEIEGYFTVLLKATETNDNISELFSQTMTPLPAASPAVSSNAYFAAAYVSSLLSSFTTNSLFANVYAYNRNLVDISAQAEGTRTLVSALEEMSVATQLMLSAIGNDGDVIVRPSQTNKWIWDTEIYVTHEKTKDHKDRQYLALAIRWCCIVTFWILVFTVLIVVYYTALVTL